MPESQASRSDNIRLYSELYDKGQATAKMLAEKILGTCSAKEVTELAEYIDKTKLLQTQPTDQLNGLPQDGLINVGASEAVK